MSIVSMGTPPSVTTGGSTPPVSGVAEKTVVVELRPVSFQISLHYLGHDRIKHHADTYRCRYELLKEGAVPAAAFTPVAAATTGSFVSVSPSPPVAGQEVTVEYKPVGGTLDGKPQVKIHYGFNNWATVVSPDPPMASALGVGWRFKFTVPEDAQQIDVAFSDGGSIWHNNDHKDWHFPTRGAEPCRKNPTTTAQACPQVIPNLVRHGPSPDPMPKAALPLGDGGDASAPPGDEIYRVEIEDNHGVSKGDLNSVFGGALSKVDSYASGTNLWTPAITPAVPFRIVVKKFLGSPDKGFEQVDLTESLKVVLELKDPREELDQNCGGRRRFAEKFFKKYNGHAGGAETTGDDNAPDTFKGTREAANPPRLDASKYTKKAPYKNTPIADEGPGVADCVEFAGLSAPGADGKRATLDVELKDGPPPTGGTATKKVGIADFAFCPGSVGGDNYRMLLTLKGGVGDAPDAGKDIREQKANGVNAALRDDQMKELPGKTGYVTGRLVVWRKVRFALMAVANDVPVGDIDFATIAASYRRSFINVVEPPSPARVVAVTRAEWIEALKKKFDATDAFFTQSDPTLQTFFESALIPGFVPSAGKLKLKGGDKLYNFPGENPDPFVHLMVRECIKTVSGRLGLTNPDGNNQKSYPDGLYILFSKSTTKSGGGVKGMHDGTLGEYIGDRIFYMFPSTPQNPPDTTYTCGHELGHALYLSHSYTSATELPFAPTVGAAHNLGIAEASTCGALADHDQHDGSDCLMSYVAGDRIQSYPHECCGMCSMILRYYDKKKIQEGGNYGSDMAGEMAAHRLLWLDSNDGKIKDSPPSVAVGQQLSVIALARPRPYEKGGGGTYTASVNVTAQGTWSKAGDPVAEVKDGSGTVITPSVAAGDADLTGTVVNASLKWQKVKGKTAGRVKITCRHGGQDASIVVTVT